MKFLTKVTAMIRKVKLTRSDVEMAKHFNVPLEEVAKKKLPKRGRPAGVKNKPKTLKVTPISDFQKTLNEWDRMENEVNFKDLCQKLQEALAKSYVEAEELEKQIVFLRNETAARDIVIRYLEGKIK